MIIATPGRLIDHIWRGRINLSNVEMLVLDEADRMLDMGFIDDVEFITDAMPESCKTLLFAATMNNATAGLAGNALREKNVGGKAKLLAAAPAVGATIYRGFSRGPHK